MQQIYKYYIISISTLSIYTGLFVWYIIDTPREIKPGSRNSRQPVKNNRKSRNEERKESRTIMVIEEPGQIWQDGTCR